MNTVESPPTSSFGISPTTVSTSPSTSTSELLTDGNTAGFSNKTIIIILSIILLLVLLNDKVDNVLRNLFIIVFNLFIRVLGFFGFITGSTLHITANVAGNVARTGVDITEGTIHSVGNILTGKNNPISPNSTPGQQPLPTEYKEPDLDNTINTSKLPEQSNIPAPDTSENPIQKSISQSKSSWCLVGEYKGKRGCIEVNEYDKCMSGQVYPSQKMCINPAIMTSAK
jgi:uncharacterized integral membrane protein